MGFLGQKKGKNSNDFQIPGVGNLEAVANISVRLNLLRMFISNDGLII